MAPRPGPGRAISEALCPDCAFPCSRAPGRGLRTLAQPPPQAGGGLLERVCPVEAFSIVPRRLAGGLRPAPLGRRRDRKAHSATPQANRVRFSVRCALWARAGMRPSARSRARPSPAAERRSSGQATARACVQRAQEVPGSQADLFRVSLGVWPAREKLRAAVTRS